MMECVNLLEIVASRKIRTCEWRGRERLDNSPRRMLPVELRWQHTALERILNHEGE